MTVQSTDAYKKITKEQLNWKSSETFDHDSKFKERAIVFEINCVILLQHILTISTLHLNQLQLLVIIAYTIIYYFALTKAIIAMETSLIVAMDVTVIATEVSLILVLDALVWNSKWAVGFRFPQLPEMPGLKRGGAGRRGAPMPCQMEPNACFLRWQKAKGASLRPLPLSPVPCHANLREEKTERQKNELVVSQ